MSGEKAEKCSSTEFWAFGDGMGVGGEVGMESITEPKEVPEEKANL